LLYAACLCWWRLSPRAVRHGCAASAVYLLGGIGLGLERLESVLPQGVVTALTLVALIGIVWAYFSASRYLTRLVFGEQAVQAGSQ
jgi:hypothetical protein